MSISDFSLRFVPSSGEDGSTSGRIVVAADAGIPGNGEGPVLYRSSITFQIYVPREAKTADLRKLGRTTEAREGRPSRDGQVGDLLKGETRGEE